MTILVRRRAALAVAAVAVVLTGLTVHALAAGWVGGLAGDALYAVLIVLLVALVAPRAPSALVGGVAFAVCAAIELLQLTGVPAQLSAAIPGAELVLGSTFQATDLIAYGVGAALAVAADLLIRRRAAGSSRDARTTPSADAPGPRPRAGTRSR